MPPVFGPVSPSPIALVVRLSDSGTHALPVAERERRDLRTLQELLDHDDATGRAERPLPTRHASIAASASSRSSATTTPLPAARPSAFTTARPPSSSTNAAAFSTSSKLPRARRRDAAALHQILRERLRALQPGRGGGRPEHGHAARLRARRPAPPPAAPPGRRRRGPGASRSTRLTICATSSTRTGWHSASSAMPGFPGAASTLVHGGILREPPHERVLAAARRRRRGPSRTSPERSVPAPGRRRSSTPARRPAPRGSARSPAPPSADPRTTCASPSSSSQPGSSSHTGSAWWNCVCVGGTSSKTCAVDPVADAHLHRLEARQDVELREHQLGEAVQPRRVRAAPCRRTTRIGACGRWSCRTRARVRPAVRRRRRAPRSGTGRYRPASRTPS